MLPKENADEEVTKARSGCHVYDWKFVSSPPCISKYTSTVLTFLSGCITTILRLRAVLTFKESFDPTWDYVPVVVWSELEITAALACVSLPAIRLLLVKMIPTKLKGWLSEVTHGSSYHTPRDHPQKEFPYTRNWHKDDVWIDLAPIEITGEGHIKNRLGFLPSAETSTSRLKTIESQSTCALSKAQSPMRSDTVAITDQSALRAPVPVKSKFGRK